MKYGYWFDVKSDDFGVLPAFDMQALSEECDRLLCDQLDYPDSQPKNRKALIDSLQEGDVVVVPSLARFTRDMEDLLSIMNQLLDKKAAFYALDAMGTEPYHGGMIPEVFAAVQSFQQTVRRSQVRREAQTIRLRGRSGGRPRVEESSLKKALRLYDRNKLSIREITERTGVSKSTLYKYLGKRRAEIVDQAG